MNVATLTTPRVHHLRFMSVTSETSGTIVRLPCKVS